MEQVIAKWRKAIRNTDRIFKGAVLENENFILDANTAQLENGKDSFDKLLWEYASDEYARFKQSIGSKAPFGIADLKLTGDFYSGFTLVVEGNEFRITSTDSKTSDLVSRYGEEIFGLTEKSITEVLPYLEESFIKLFRNELL